MRFLQRTALIFAAITLSLQLAAQTPQTRHEVKGGETLYSISRLYGISVEDLRKANPSMGDVLLAGSVIKIPTKTQDARQNHDVQPTNPMDETVPSNPSSSCKMMHKVEKKETVYGIARQFDLTEEELLAANPQIDVKKNKIKKGEYLCIPYSRKELAEHAAEQKRIEAERAKAEAKRQAEEAARIEAERKQKALNVAVIMPFSLKSKYKTRDSIKLIDFYEGFLLGVTNMKARGHNVNVFAYEDTGGDCVDSLLRLPQMKRMQLMIGPVDVARVTAVNHFCKEQGICHVVPFSSRDTLLNGCPNTFLVNTSVNILYPTVYEQFLKETPTDAMVVFINCADKGDKLDFIAGLKQTLDQQHRSYRAIELSQLEKLNDLGLNTMHPLYFVPSSASPKAFDQVVKKLEANSNLSDYRYYFFGHPEWLTFTGKNFDNLLKHHASFYTQFYTYKSSASVTNFENQFTHWFKRENTKTNPNYSYLGYDIARYFIHGLVEFGPDFYNATDKVDMVALQTPMHFQRKSNGDGFYNTHVKIIKF